VIYRRGIQQADFASDTGIQANAHVSLVCNTRLARRRPFSQPGHTTTYLHGRPGTGNQGKWARRPQLESHAEKETCESYPPDRLARSPSSSRGPPTNTDTCPRLILQRVLPTRSPCSLHPHRVVHQPTRAPALGQLRSESYPPDRLTRLDPHRVLHQSAEANAGSPSVLNHLNVIGRR
jgi:hypothetical protein